MVFWVTFFRMFVEPGDRVVTSAGAYPTFNYHVVGYDGVLGNGTVSG
ncbi:MAG: hypothetical protein Ct9H300mP16_03700 [Pseudomonadota bacterium]|nr:MAG: hypothetical protein Ct9H300mP16_03700 [Pseudomonadota bacterium]